MKGNILVVVSLLMLAVIGTSLLVVSSSLKSPKTAFTTSSRAAMGDSLRDIDNNSQQQNPQSTPTAPPQKTSENRSNNFNPPSRFGFFNNDSVGRKEIQQEPETKTIPTVTPEAQKNIFTGNNNTGKSRVIDSLTIDISPTQKPEQTPSTENSFLKRIFDPIIDVLRGLFNR